MVNSNNMTDIVKQSFTQYAAAVIQSRALVDVRDGLKPSTRQIFYCMDKYKYVAVKPFQKTMAAIGDAMVVHYYRQATGPRPVIPKHACQNWQLIYLPTLIKKPLMIGEIITQIMSNIPQCFLLKGIIILLTAVVVSLLVWLVLFLSITLRN